MYFGWVNSPTPDEAAPKFVKPDPPALLRGGLHSQGPKYSLTVLDTLQEPLGNTNIVLWYTGTAIDPDRFEWALSRSLSCYPMLAGRLKAAARGPAYVLCNDAGVLFTVAKRKLGAAANQMAPHGPRDIPAVCMDKTQVHRYISQVDGYSACLKQDTQPLCSFKLTLLSQSKVSNRHFDAQPTWVLGVSVLGALLDMESLAGFLQVVANSYRGIAPAPINLDRNLYIKTALEMAGETEWTHPPLPCSQSQSSLRALFSKVVSNVASLSCALCHFTANDIANLDGARGGDLEHAVVAEMWYMTAELKQALEQTQHSTSQRENFNSAEKRQSKKKKSLTLGHSKTTSLFVSSSFRSSGWLPENYFGNASLLSQIPLAVVDLVKFDTPTLAHLVEATRQRHSTTFPEAVQWLTHAENSGSRVAYNLGSRKDINLIADIVPVHSFKEVQFSDDCQLLYANVPPKLLPWSFTLVPLVAETSSPTIDVHVTLPTMAMEVLQADMPNKIVGNVLWNI